ncbi:unnamed protein product [Gadus morhua 'NCC']
MDESHSGGADAADPWSDSRPGNCSQHILVFSLGMRTAHLPRSVLKLPVGDNSVGQEEDPSGAMQPGS